MKQRRQGREPAKVVDGRIEVRIVSDLGVRE